MKPIDYFEKTSETYSDNVSSGLFGLIKKKEKEAFFELFVEPKKESEILDIGCGPGIYSVSLKKMGYSVVAFDFSPKMVKLARERGINAKVKSAEDFFYDKKFSTILLLGILDYTNNPEKIIQNSSRHLKKGGLIYLSVPMLSPIGLIYKLYHILFHRFRPNLFSVKKLTDLLNSNGLVIDKIISKAGYIAVVRAVKK